MTAFDTRAVHAGHDPAQHNGSVTTPIYQVSTFVRPHARHWPAEARHPDVLPGRRTFGPDGQDLRPLPRRGQIRWIGAMADQIVVGDRVLLHVSFSAVRDRLGILARDGMLPCVSEVAYGEGITNLVKMAGPVAGTVAGLTRLAGARLEDVAETDDCVHVVLQWEAIAADGKLFTALDADLMLAPAGGQHTALALAGAYRPQPGWAGAGLNRAIVRRCAQTAISSFLTQVASALVHSALRG